MKTSDYFYELPPECIAQTPVEPRDHSRLMVIDREREEITHRHFYDLAALLKPGDVLVVNDTRVIPARLLGVKEGTDTAVELLLLKQLDQQVWETLVKPGRRLRSGDMCSFGNGLLRAEIIDKVEETGGRRVRFHYEGVFEALLDQLGEMPLPPYIHEKTTDSERYQTVYARERGSAAAPTAGLHFTQVLLQALQDKGIIIAHVLLHVGLGTFRPVKATDLSEHVMHSEYYEVTAEAAQRINSAKEAGGKIICVGTTAVRTLETVSDDQGHIHAGKGNTSIFIHPGVRIRAVDGLITNFHLPESTLLMLVSAFWHRNAVLKAYATAVEAQYRFFSFGDAMLLLPSRGDIND